jgi:Xaa-Pro aminopeptidase
MDKAHPSSNAPASALSADLRALAAGIAAAPLSRTLRSDVTMLLGCRRTTQTVEAVLHHAKLVREQLAEPDPLPVQVRIELLRRQMANRGLAGYLVPHDDEFGLEYTPFYAGRLAWISNFTGSAGVAIVLADKAKFVSDGRYKIKAASQIDAALFDIEISEYMNRTAIEWLARNVKPGFLIGYDPQLINPACLKLYATAVEAAGGKMMPFDENLIDLVWERQPARPISPFIPHPLELAGQSWTEKVTGVVARLKQLKVGAAVITDPASVAWLFNIRGNDLECTPLPLSYAIVYEDGNAVIFCDQRCITVHLLEHFDGGKIELRSLHLFGKYLEALGQSGSHVLVDPGTTNSATFDRLEASGARIVTAEDPCALPRARKNKVELENTRRAHIRDGAALCRLHAWFDREAGRGGLTEMAVVRRLLALRSKDPRYTSESFSTIVAAGENSRNVHYFPTIETDRPIAPGDCVLMDTGAQYIDGTTDSTRVRVAGGRATEQVRRTFTLVLKGHIAISKQRFPITCTGTRLDTLARSALWQAGLDFDHGVGHGVGSYLSVHEGPQRISYKLADQLLEEGMILSNEPGAYDYPDHGVRLENLLVVGRARSIEGGTRDMRSFEVLTMVPFDRALIDERLLTKDELLWLNDYHATVLRNISPLLDGDDLDWLKEATRPLEFHTRQA